MEGSHTVSLSSAAATRHNAARTITLCMQTTQCVSSPFSCKLVVGRAPRQYQQRAQEVFRTLHHWWLPLVCTCKLMLKLVTSYNECIKVTCRRILVFPRGNRPGVTVVSAYLDCGEPGTQPVGWSRRATFKLSLVNQRDATKTICKGMFKCTEHAAMLSANFYCIIVVTSFTLMQRQRISFHLRPMIGDSLHLPHNKKFLVQALVSWSMTPCG